MLRPTEIVYMAAGQPLLSNSFPAHRGSCALCRRPLRGGDGAVHVRDAIKPTFTNRDLLNPYSSLICVACAYCLRTPELRRRDFVATPEKLTFLSRSQLAEALLNPPRDKPFVFCVGLSHKKHLVIRTRVNLSPINFYVQFEEQGVWVQPHRHKQVLFSIQALLKTFTKTAIREAAYPPTGKISPDSLLQLESIIKPYRGSRIFQLLLHAAQSPKQKGGKKQNG